MEKIKRFISNKIINNINIPYVIRRFFSISYHYCLSPFFVIRIFTSHIRLLPDFIIIGAQKCATTTLFRYFNKHPNISMAFSKEINFFNQHYKNGIYWYRAHFPTKLYKYYITHIRKNKFIAGEASVSYFTHPYTPRKIFKLMPDIKLILLIRNPIDRAYSHYQHTLRNNLESLPFEKAIALEKKE